MHQKLLEKGYNTEAAEHFIYIVLLLRKTRVKNKNHRRAEGIVSRPMANNGTNSDSPAAAMYHVFQQPSKLLKIALVLMVMQNIIANKLLFRGQQDRKRR